MNSKKALWMFVGLLFVGAIIAAAVLGTRGGGVTTAPPDGPGASPPAPTATVTFDAPRAAPVYASPAIDAVAAVAAAAKPDASAAAVDAAAPAAAAAAPDAAAAEAPAPAPTPTPPQPTPTPAPSPSSADIQFDEPRVVGDVDPQPIIDALEKIKPQLDSCRPKTKETAKVKVQFHVGLGGLRLAAPAADNSGDASVARCIANRVKSAKPVWKADESGIIIVDATVPPRP